MNKKISPVVAIDLSALAKVTGGCGYTAAAFEGGKAYQRVSTEKKHKK